MATVLFSKEGKYRVVIREIPNDIDDGFFYKVEATGRIFQSIGGAVRSARMLLKKWRFKYYKKHPEKRVRIKAKRLVPKVKKKTRLLKLYVMDKDAAKILVRMSDNKLKLHSNYSRKKFNNEKTTAVSGETTDFSSAIATVMKDGTKKERKTVSKMMLKFIHEPFQKTNMFY